MAGIYPLSRMQQFNKANGAFLSGGKLYLFVAGSTTPLVGYKDYGLVAVHSNPIDLDAAGRVPMIYLADGSYKHRLTDKSGVVQFEDDNIPVTGPSGGGGGGGGSVDPTSVFDTRDIKIRFDDQPLAGYVRCNGRTIGSAVSGATERANADTQSLFEEMWAYTNIAVVGGKGASAAADWASDKQLTLPNASEKLLGGFGGMGNGDDGRITQANFGVDPTVLGATGGAEKLALTKAQLPVLGLAANVTDPTHLHSLGGSLLSGNDGVVSGYTGGSFFAPIGTKTQTVAAATGISVAIPEVGGGATHSNLPPMILFMVYIKL